MDLSFLKSFKKSYTINIFNLLQLLKVIYFYYLVKMIMYLNFILVVYDINVYTNLNGFTISTLYKYQNYIVHITIIIFNNKK